MEKLMGTICFFAGGGWKSFTICKNSTWPQDGKVNWPLSIWNTEEEYFKKSTALTMKEAGSIFIAFSSKMGNIVKLHMLKNWTLGCSPVKMSQFWSETKKTCKNTTKK